ncbi:hypothetical protein BsWGS_12792 [Bradybaena similaris]
MSMKSLKKISGAGRAGSASHRGELPVISSASGIDLRRPKLNIWPEWNDADINAEKWEASKKEEKKTPKSPVLQQTHGFFDDPEGKIELPPSLKVDTWKRPGEFVRAPVVVDADTISKGFDIITTNEHLHESEFMRHCIGQIITLRELCAVNNPTESMADLTAPTVDATHSWYPWEHIYSLCKIGKGPHMPLYNVYGKYVIRLYWMGCWRKITVDDTIPFDSQGRFLLPTTTLQHELWPMLLTKALIKVASLDYTGGNPNQEFGDVSVIQCLTGWIPEALPLRPAYMHKAWEVLKFFLPDWKLPPQEWQKSLEDTENLNLVKDPSASEIVTKDEKMDKEAGHKDGKEKSKAKRESNEKDKIGKDEKKDKKDKGKEKSAVEDLIIPEKPEVVIFASYHCTHRYTLYPSVLKERADASERLRQSGLSYMYPHPVHIAETRSCPLEPPPPPVVLPAWKMIRPRPRKTLPSDEPECILEEPKPVQCLKIMSPFLNYKVNPMAIPTDTHCRKSSLDIHQTRSVSDDNIIVEGDENAPTPPPVVSVPKSFVPQQLKEIVKEEEVQPTVKHKSPGKAVKDVKKSLSAKNKSQLKFHETELFKTDIATAGESGGMAPLSSTSGFKDDATVVDDEMAESSSAHTPKKPTSFWMDFDVFMKCFSVLYLYHKTNTYPCNHRFSEPKSLSSLSAISPSKPDKKGFQTVQMSSDNSAPFFLFVDNLAPTEIVVSYSALVKWFDPPLIYDERERKSSVHSKQSLKDHDPNLALNLDDKSQQAVSDQKSPSIVVPGKLYAEEFSWKSLAVDVPLLRIETTGTSCKLLSLPPGRHVLRFHATSPLGHHVHMFSTVNFSIGDEETVMPQLTSESLRFRECATQLIVSLGKCMLGFSDAVQFNKASADLVKCYCPYLDNKLMSKKQNYQIFIDALYQLLRRNLKDIISPEIAFAWRAFNFDVTTPNILSIPVGSRPDTQQSTVSATASHRGSGRTSVKRHSQSETGEPDKSELSWSNRQPSVSDMVAAVKIQKVWRGFYARKIKEARTPGTLLNAKVAENLKKCWPLIEALQEANGVFLLREMFKKDPDILQYYPFYTDESSRIAYADYKGVFPEQSSMNWFVIFRDIFIVKEDMLVVPTVSVPVNTCRLHVIDNDTGTELRRTLNRVAPCVYKKNKKGYSFVAEARTLEHTLPSGMWRMRIIGTLNPLPFPRSGDVCSNFVTKEIRNYYIPNTKNIIFRQSVKVKDDHFASIQMNTSKSDVVFKLAVLDNEEEVISVEGKGHAVIPAFTFLKTITQEDLDKRSGSRAYSLGLSRRTTAFEDTNKTSPPTAPIKEKASKSRRSESVAPTEQQQTNKQSILHFESDFGEKLEDTTVHKYIIQATVLRNSWPLSERSWKFVLVLKELEMREQMLNPPESPASLPKYEKPQPQGNKSKLKSGKEKGQGYPMGKDNREPHPTSQQFDFSMPHWTLRIVSDAYNADEIEVKKDTERAEQIKAMKKAWEAAQPGRAAKAFQSRQKYLNTYGIKPSQSEETTVAESLKEESVTTASIAGTTPSSGTDTSGSSELESSSQIFLTGPQVPPSFFNESETNLTLEPPPHLLPKPLVPPMDFTPYLRKTLDVPVFKDEKVIAMLLEKKQKEIAEWQAHRETVLKWREADKQYRNLMKMRQLEQYQAMQTDLDEKREIINTAREAYRHRLLEVERIRQEQLAAQEAALRSDHEVRSPKAKKTVAGRKKK